MARSDDTHSNDDIPRLRLPDPLRSSRLRPPESVRIEGNSIVWRQGFGPRDASLRGCLSAFARLRLDKDGSDILDFYRTYGAVGAVDETWPNLIGKSWFTFSFMSSFESAAVEEPRPPSLSTDIEYAEPLARLRALARSVSAALVAADHLARGETVPNGAWEALFPDYGGAAPSFILLGKFMETLTSWLQQTGFYVAVRPLEDFRTGRHEFNLRAGLGGYRGGGMSGPGEFRPEAMGVVVAQLIAAITNPRGMATCSECGTPYRPIGKWPREDWQHWCSPGCKREASKRYRREQAKQRRAKARQERKER